MTLAKRIIPTILCRGKTAYKGRKFVSDRSIGSALATAQVHARRGVDELIILDISATAEGRGPDLEMVQALSAGCFIPITVGGGVRSIKDIDDLLRAGADKVAVCTAAWEDPHFVPDASKRFGCQAIVGVVEHTAVVMSTRNASQRHPMTALQWAMQLERMGAGELMLCRTDRDGTQEGYDLEMIKAVSSRLEIPLIASGGCRDYDDMQAAFKAGADGCAAGAMFAFSDMTPRGAAMFLQQRNVEVRL